MVCGNFIYKVPALTRGSTVNLASNIWKDMNAIVGLPAGSKYYIKVYNDPVEYGTDTHSSTAVADLDNDTNIDVVLSGAVGSTTGQTAVFYWNPTKQTVSTYSGGYACCSRDSVNGLVRRSGFHSHARFPQDVDGDGRHG